MKRISLDGKEAREPRRDAAGRPVPGGVSVVGQNTGKAPEAPSPTSLEGRVRKMSKVTTVACGVAALGLAFGIYANASTSAELTKVHDGMTNVVVAKSEVGAGTAITADQLEVREVPREYVSTGALSETDAFVGKVATTRIDAGSQVTDAMTAASRNPASLASATSKGKMAVTVSVDEAQGLSTLLKVGDVVDILGTKSSNAKTLSRVASKATVIALGSSMDGSSDSYSSVTLEVTPKQADSVRVAQSNGSTWLELHAKADQKGGN